MGKGKNFWQGDRNGSPVNGSYENWGSGEPNDHGSGTGTENYLVMKALQPDATRARWNDLPRYTGAARGYVLEVD